MIELIEAELDRLARERRSPEGFEALFHVLWLYRQMNTGTPQVIGRMAHVRPWLLARSSLSRCPVPEPGQVGDEWVPLVYVPEAES